MSDEENIVFNRIDLAGENIEISDMLYQKNYIITPDPEDPSNPHSWVAIITNVPGYPEFTDVVLRYLSIQFKGNEIAIKVEVVHTPDKKKHAREKIAMNQQFMKAASLIAQDFIKVMQRMDSIIWLDDEGKELPPGDVKSNWNGET